MEVVIAIILSAVLYMQGLQYLGNSQPKTQGAGALAGPKTVGLVAGVGALALASLAIFRPLNVLTKSEPEAIATATFVLAIYAALVAAVGLWDFDPRGLGWYSGFAALSMLGQIYSTSVVAYTLAGIIEGIVLFVAFGVVFLYLALRMESLRALTAWVLLIGAAVLWVLVGLVLGKTSGLLS